MKYSKEKDTIFGSLSLKILNNANIQSIWNPFSVAIQFLFFPCLFQTNLFAQTILSHLVYSLNPTSQSKTPLHFDYIIWIRQKGVGVPYQNSTASHISCPSEFSTAKDYPFGLSVESSNEWICTQRKSNWFVLY